MQERTKRTLTGIITGSLWGLGLFQVNADPNTVMWAKTLCLLFGGVIIVGIMWEVAKMWLVPEYIEEE